MTLPNFFIIGAPKSGTTSLYNYIKQHPQAFMSKNKEPYFFVSDEEKQIRIAAGLKPVMTIEEYENLFEDAADALAVGEASVPYLFQPESPRLIRKMIPNAKLIAVLRNPVDRAYSSYWHLRRLKMEPEAIFEKAIESELAGKRDKQISILRHVAKGLYAQQLQNYFAVFQREQIRIFLYEDFSSQPQVVLKDIWRFLQIDDTYIADTSNRFNVTSVRPSLLTRANHRLKINFSAFSGQSRLGAKPAAEEQQINRPPVLSRETRRHLIQVCSNDILELQNLLGRDLSGWLDVVSNEN